MPITISRTLVFRLVSAISCSSIWTVLVGYVYSALFISWLEAWSQALLLTLCCMSHSSPLQNHLIHLLFQLVCSLDILVSSGGDHSNPRTEFAADTSTLWKVLHGSSGAFFLPKLSHRQQVDNGLQGSVDFHASFRAYLRHHEAETRRRSCCPHGWSGMMEVTWPPLFMKKNILYIFRVRCFLRQRSILNFICRDP